MKKQTAESIIAKLGSILREYAGYEGNFDRLKYSEYRLGQFDVYEWLLRELRKNE